MKAATYIAKFLKEKQINIVFELQGGMITHILDAMHQEGSFEIVSMHHEQAASFAADAYARVTGKPGVAFATSGPGATNLITGIGSCYFDSVPAIFITGQVNINEQKGDRGIRQLGFQETDIVEIIRPLTKAAFAVKSVNDLPLILENAYYISKEGRPGPVLIDIPMNIQREDILDLSVNTNRVQDERVVDKSEILSFCVKLNKALSKSLRPLVLAGRGVRAGDTNTVFKRFIETYNLPVVHSLLGLDNLPFSHHKRIGMIGAYGNRWANYALDNCDLLLVLGSRIDVRQTGADVESFRQNKKIFHVDCELTELNNRIKDCIVLRTCLNDFFRIEL